MTDDPKNIKLDKIKNIDELPKSVQPNQFTIDELNKKVDKIIEENNFDSMYQAFFENTNALMCISLSNGHLIRVNGAFTSCLGYSKEELIGKSVLDFIHPDDIESTINAQNKIYKENELMYFENRWIKKDNQPIRLEWSSNEYKNIYFSIATVKNEVDEYLSNITHELRTPLNCIVGFIDLLKLSDGIGETETQYLKHMEQSSKQLISLINNIISLGKINKSGYKINKINLKEYLIERLENFIPVLKEKSIILDLHLSYFDNKINIEEDKLNQILNNIISNAIKFNNKNGKITISSTLSDNVINIIITDNGRGIHDEFKKLLFVSFKRQYKNISGTGLGLIITKKLINLFQGKIKIDSKLGEGTTITISFPLIENKNNLTFDKTIKSYNKITKKPKILYVEDNELNIIILRQYINKIYNESVNFECEKTCTSAYKNILNNPPDLLILDFHMPDYNSDQLYKEVKELEQFKKIKHVVFISADQSTSKIDYIKDLGIDEYIIKPIRFSKFYNLVTSIIPIDK